MGRKRLGDGARTALLISLNPFEKSDVRVRVVPCFVHILQAQEIGLALRIATELQVGQRKSDVQAFIKSVPGQSAATQQHQGNRCAWHYLTPGPALRPTPRCPV